MSDPAQTVTLSDGSVWQYLREVSAPWLCSTPNAIYAEQPWLIVSSMKDGRHYPLTAGDHRAIADVLDPPLLPSPSEREELARVIAGHTNLDWGAHNMTDLVDEEHESGEAETCEGCLKVADAVLAAGYSKRSSPSSAGQEVREAVRQALTKLAMSMASSDMAPWVRIFRDREYPALTPYTTEETP